MRLINTPLSGIFFDLVRESRSTIKLCSPFVKEDSVVKILQNTRDGVRMSLVTSINLRSFHNGASDVAALERVCNAKGTIYNFQRLHAKVYIFDNKSLIITSANLTPSGMERNYEYGVFITENDLVKQATTDYHTICRCQDTGRIGRNNIHYLRDVLGSLQTRETVSMPVLRLIPEDGTYALIDKELVETSAMLSGWKKRLFDQLSMLDKQTFTTYDCMQLAPKMHELYPANNHVHAKIRQVLQQLRDVGLVKFEGDGVYTKLWR